MIPSTIFPETILAAYNKQNYILSNTPYSLNIFGIRNKQPVVNTFCDLLGWLFINAGGTWSVATCKATTDPGLYWLQNPTNVKGTAILVPGQYPNSHKVGLHKGEYRALVQNAPLKVWRDRDKDNILDHDPASIDVGMFGINIHHAGVNSTQVDNWSAGCQVYSVLNDFNSMMSAVDDQITFGGGDVITYTLFDETQVFTDN